MWDSPSWIGSAISAKIKRDSDAANRLSNERIAAEDRASREAIATADRLSKEQIAAADRSSKEGIASADRTSRENIESANRSNALAVASIQAASHAVPKILPLFIGKGFIDNNNSNNNNIGNKSGTGVTTTTKVSTAQKRADEAFPTLTPTFSSKVKDLVNNVGLGAHTTTGMALTTTTGAVNMFNMMLPVLL